MANDDSKAGKIYNQKSINQLKALLNSYDSKVEKGKKNGGDVVELFKKYSEK